MALFLPALLLCRDFRLDAELRWGPKREPRTFTIDANDGLVSHYADTGTYVPAELTRLRRPLPPGRTCRGSYPRPTEVIELGREGVWVPDYKFIHKAERDRTSTSKSSASGSGSSLDRLLRLLPQHGPTAYVLAISDRFKVDEEALDDLKGPVLRFREIPNAVELAALLDRFVKAGEGGLPFG